MTKMDVAIAKKQNKRDLEYFMENYSMNQKEAYAYMYERYKLRLALISEYVETKEREEITARIKGVYNG